MPRWKPYEKKRKSISTLHEENVKVFKQTIRSRLQCHNLRILITVSRDISSEFRLEFKKEIKMDVSGKEKKELLPEDLPAAQLMELNDVQTQSVIGGKTYLIWGSDGESNLCVRILDNSSKQCTTPIVLGVKPKACLAHSALILNKDRILIILKDSTPDDCFWFLEVDTEFVKVQKKLLNCEVVAWSKGVKGESPMPVVISGPSGVGKGTLISKLMEEFPSTFGFSVSHTTRAPRVNEKDGVHYHFTERTVMEKAIQECHFLEFASVHGNLYGTSIEAVETVTDAGKRCILDIDVQGAKSVRASSIQSVFIFISPPSMEELERRLRARGTEVEDQVQKRLQNAREELKQARFPGLFDHILVNDDLENCYKTLKDLLNLHNDTKLIDDSLPKTSVDPEDKSTPGMNGKFLVRLGKNPDNFFLLELSSLNGGAPGRTRGFNFHAVTNTSQNNLQTME